MRWVVCLLSSVQYDTVRRRKRSKQSVHFTMQDRWRYYHDMRPDDFSDHLPPLYTILDPLPDFGFFPFTLVLILVRVDLADGGGGCTY
jgi:hypothetical protein